MPHCGGRHVIKYGVVSRTLHNLPFGSKPCYLSLQIQRCCCKDCGSVWQSDIPFTHGEVSYTYRFSRYILELLRMIKDVALHLFHAYYLKEDLDQIWMQDNKEDAEKQLCYWYERARETKLQPFIKVANTLMIRRIGILVWYDAFVTNPMLEGINNKIKVMERKAYDYRDDQYFNLLLLGLHDKTNAIRG